MRWLLICINILLVALLLLSVKEAEACSCQLSHIQTKYCDSDFVAAIRVKGVNEGDYTNPTIYSVKVKEVFKYLQGTNLVLVDKIYTPSSSSFCSVKLELNQTYLVGGKWESGKPSISLCGLAMQWKNATVRQRIGLRRLYKTSCECQIPYTSFNRKASVLENSNGTKCVWESEPGPFTCQEQHGICRKGPNGCYWERSDPYKTCIQEHILNQEQRKSKEV